jgi:hypothetical protein
VQIQFIQVVLCHSDSDDCPLEQCHWWKLEARPSGEVALVEEGGKTP